VTINSVGERSCPPAKEAFKLSVSLDVSLPNVGDRKTAADLVHAAHQVCPYSNATRGNIDVELLLDGPIDMTGARVGNLRCLPEDRRSSWPACNRR